MCVRVHNGHVILKSIASSQTCIEIYMGVTYSRERFPPSLLCFRLPPLETTFPITKWLLAPMTWDYIIT